MNERSTRIFVTNRNKIWRNNDNKRDSLKRILLTRNNRTSITITVLFILWQSVPSKLEIAYSLFEHMHFHSRSTFCPCDSNIHIKFLIEIFQNVRNLMINNVNAFERNRTKNYKCSIETYWLMQRELILRWASFGHTIVNVNSFRIVCSGLHIANTQKTNFSRKKIIKILFSKAESKHRNFNKSNERITTDINLQATVYRIDRYRFFSIMKNKNRLSAYRSTR